MPMPLQQFAAIASLATSVATCMEQFTRAEQPQRMALINPAARECATKFARNAAETILQLCDEAEQQPDD